MMEVGGRNIKDKGSGSSNERWGWRGNKDEGC